MFEGAAGGARRSPRPPAGIWGVARWSGGKRGCRRAPRFSRLWGFCPAAGACHAGDPYTVRVAANLTLVPRDAVILPLPVRAPAGFVPERPETWPKLAGRYEFVEGRLEYMPPCGEIQQCVAADVVGELGTWRRANPGFNVGGNEAGMILGGDVRAADAAVWPAKTPGLGFARTPPILAVEVAGADDTLEYLEKKSEWYLSHGVECIWIVMPDTRSVRVVTKAGRVDVGVGGRIPEHASLPGLVPDVSAFFQQL